MAEILKIKSRAVTVYDYRNADITQFVKGFTVDEEQYAKDLVRVLKKYGVKTEANTVSDGDSVTVSCVSELPRYNKPNVPVIVGRGLFGRDAEAALIGMSRGETKRIEQDGKAVELTVSRIVRTVLPELNDENVASFGIEGVSTVRELRKSLVAKQIDGFILEDENADVASAFVWQEVANNSVVERDPEEYDRMLKTAEKRVDGLQELYQNQEEDDEDTEPDGLEEEGPGMNREKLISIFVAELDLAAIGAGMMEREGIFLTADDYRFYIDKLAEAYPDRTREGLEKEHSKLDFCVERCSNYLAGLIDRYVADCFKEILTKDI